ncbi:hypothetical protein NE237_018083 [Protea cynaroides]|uniref:Uncharacterized protein n=1 Tax=Protea cynaroides TaxID=273540 RepID=A0A9Q0K9A4_9MAGN|nr:hypothetical protein NE237_018083 [Protea cynaroides]
MPHIMSATELPDLWGFYIHGQWYNLVGSTRTYRGTGHNELLSFFDFLSTKEDPGWWIWPGSSSQRTGSKLGGSGPLLNAEGTGLGDYGDGMLPSKQGACLGDSGALLIAEGARA